MKKQPLTKKQKETLDLLKTFNKKKGYMPTYVEIGESLKIGTTSAFVRIQSLIQRGWIKRTIKPRGIVLK